MNATTLCAFVWGNGLNPDPEIELSIIRTADAYRPGRDPCQLCIGEKKCINEQSENHIDYSQQERERKSGRLVTRLDTSWPICYSISTQRRILKSP